MGSDNGLTNINGVKVVDSTQWYIETKHKSVKQLESTSCRNIYVVDTVEGRKKLTEGDWIITDANGGVYVRKEDILEQIDEHCDPTLEALQRIFGMKPGGYKE